MLAGLLTGHIALSRHFTVMHVEMRRKHRTTFYVRARPIVVRHSIMGAHLMELRFARATKMFS